MALLKIQSMTKEEMRELLREKSFGHERSAACSQRLAWRNLIPPKRYML